jgi:hypothetical protein
MAMAKERSLGSHVRIGGVTVYEGLAAIGDDSVGHRCLLFDETHSHLFSTDATSFLTTPGD